MAKDFQQQNHSISFTRSLLGLVGFIMAVVALVSFDGVAHAKAEKDPSIYTQTTPHRITSYLQEEAYVRGYTSLVLNYPFIRQQMISDIQQGKSQQWLQWLTPGVQHQYSLYWWLLAEWHNTQGDKKKAYAAAVQAMVLSKIEMQTCRGNKDHRQMAHDALMFIHKDIINHRPSQDEIRTSVLTAVARTEAYLKKGSVLSGQSCFRLYALTQKIPDDLSKQWQRRNDKASDGLVRQTKALEDIKVQLSYSRIIQTSTIEQIWASDEKRSTVPPKRSSPKL